jgi:hypothetical protein
MILLMIWCEKFFFFFSEMINKLFLLVFKSLSRCFASAFEIVLLWHFFTVALNDGRRPTVGSHPHPLSL